MPFIARCSQKKRYVPIKRITIEAPWQMQALYFSIWPCLGPTTLEILDICATMMPIQEVAFDSASQLCQVRSFAKPFSFQTDLMEVVKYQDDQIERFPENRSQMQCWMTRRSADTEH